MLIGVAGKAPHDSLSFWLWKRIRVTLKSSVLDRIATEKVIKLAKFVAVVEIREMKLLMNVIGRGRYVRFKTAINNIKLVKICKDRKRGFCTAVCVTDRLEAIVRSVKNGRRTLGLDKETLLSKVGL